MFGFELEIADANGSRTVDIVASELINDRYGVGRIPFSPGDAVVDIGAHVGLFSIVMSKLHPAIRILAYEPYPPNFLYLRHNLARNGVANVSCFDRAITGDGRRLTMVTNPRNTGGATACSRTLTFAPAGDIASATLDSAFDQNGIEHCRLLKMDCEGGEHEILLTSTVLNRVDYLSCESHSNQYLTRQGYSHERLRTHCARLFAADRLRLTYCQMSE